MTDKELIEGLKRENAILARCLKHEQELNRKLQDKLDALYFAEGHDKLDMNR